MKILIAEDDFTSRAVLVAVLPLLRELRKMTRNGPVASAKSLLTSSPTASDGSPYHPLCHWPWVGSRMVVDKAGQSR